MVRPRFTPRLPGLFAALFTALACTFSCTLTLVAPADALAARPAERSASMVPVTPATAVGAPHAQPVALDPKLVQYTYDPNFTYTIVTSAGKLTHVQLAADEKVLGIYLVDAGASWRQQVSKVTQRDVFFNPADNGLEQTGTIITNRRRYEINLVSKETPDYFQRVSWQYPQAGDQSADAASDMAWEGSDSDVGGPGSSGAVDGVQLPEGMHVDSPASGRAQHGDSGSGITVDLSRAHFGYTIKGDAPFRPTMVFDDGQATYIRFPSDIQALPAAFLLTPDGKAQTLSFVPRDGYYRVTRLVDYGMLLMLGGKEVRIFNKAGKGCGFFGCDDHTPVNFAGNH